jgi:hypothetical protein
MRALGAAVGRFFSGEPSSKPRKKFLWILACRWDDFERTRHPPY